MKVVFTAGSHGSGKTSLLVHVLKALPQVRAGVFKVDPHPSGDADRFMRHGIPAVVHCSGDVCPDHETLVVLADALEWARTRGIDVLAIESAGLCHRCSPFLRRVLAVCVVSGLSNLSAPGKARILVETADIVVLTHSEILSPAEHEIFRLRLSALNPLADVVSTNGRTGEGTHVLVSAIQQMPDTRFWDVEPLRSTLPAGYCHFCQGIGSGHE